MTIAEPIFGRDYIAATEPMKIGKHCLAPGGLPGLIPCALRLFWGDFS